MAEAAKAGAGGEQDLSMEEILQSIRRIISEDDDPNKAGAAPSQDLPAAPPGSDVLELTEMVKDDGSIESLKAEPAAAVAVSADSGDVLSKIDQALAAEKPTPPPPPVEAKPVEVAPPPPPPAPKVESKPMEEQKQPAVPALPAESIMSEAPAASVSEAFKTLRNAETPLPPLVTTPAPAFRSGLTVEDMVIDMLKPMMKDWLDKNLPPLVERLVEREVRRLTKQP